MRTRDLTERLRFHGRFASESQDERSTRKIAECEEAAATIEALRSEVERLHADRKAWALQWQTDVSSAADRAEAAERALAEALEVVEPFSGAAEHVPADQEDFKLVAYVPGGEHAQAFQKLRNSMTAGDFRRAAAFIAKHSGTETEDEGLMGGSVK
jgi:hypothetical protein